MSQAVTAHGGSEAASLRVAEQYLSAFGQIAKAGNTLLLPAATNDPANMVAQALSIYKTVAENHPSSGPRYVLFVSGSPVLGKGTQLSLGQSPVQECPLPAVMQLQSSAKAHGQPDNRYLRVGMPLWSCVLVLTGMSCPREV